MGKSAPSPPPAPDYAGAATAQGAANVQAAKATSQLNNPNVVGPYGTQTWTDVPGTADPSVRPTMVQTLSPAEAGILGTTEATKQQVAELAGQGATAAKGVVGTPVDFSGAPPAPGPPGQIRSDVVDAMMARVNTDHDVAASNMRSQLVSSGIPVGSDAYNRQMDLIERSRNDARNLAIQAGTGAAAQDYAQTAESRRNAIAEALTKRSLPINEITALESGSQVTSPFATPGASQGAQVAPPPLYAATTATGQYATDVYNQQMAARNAQLGGLYGLGGAGLMAGGLAASDRRLKSNIVRVGIHPLGIGIYAYDVFGRRRIGVMADEVIKVRPEAVVHRFSGYLMVDYGAL